jgi:hypothetical protein
MSHGDPAPPGATQVPGALPETKIVPASTNGRHHTPGAHWVLPEGPAPHAAPAPTPAAHFPFETSHHRLRLLQGPLPPQMIAGPQSASVAHYDTTEPYG